MLSNNVVGAEEHLDVARRQVNGPACLGQGSVVSGSSQSLDVEEGKECGEESDEVSESVHGEQLRDREGQLVPGNVCQTGGKEKGAEGIKILRTLETAICFRCYTQDQLMLPRCSSLPIPYQCSAEGSDMSRAVCLKRKRELEGRRGELHKIASRTVIKLNMIAKYRTWIDL